jgi:predicted phosphodiesterase
MASPVSLEPFTARTVAVLADCHIHPGGGPDWTDAQLAALAGVELIVTLGDMGEAAGLERLAAIAPVVGVRGQDDSQDPRTAAALRALRIGDVTLACLFDPAIHDLACSADPFTPVSGWAQKADSLFGGRIDALLHASTHKPAISWRNGRLVINPGSLTLPVGQETGAAGAFARLTIGAGAIDAEIVFVR